MARARYFQADAQITQGPGRLYSVTLYTNLADSYAKFYDTINSVVAAANGNMIAYLAGDSTNNQQSTVHQWYTDEGIDFRSGLYLDIDGVSAAVVVQYKPLGK